MKQRNEGFNNFIVLGDKKGDGPTVFESYSLGVATGRDAWCFNMSNAQVMKSMKGMIEFYDAELDRFNAAHGALEKKSREQLVDGFINTEPSRISWTRALKSDLAKDKHFTFNSNCITRAIYRPYTKQWLYFDRRFNEMVYQMPRLFPEPNSENLAIMVKGNWRGEGQFA